MKKNYSIVLVMSVLFFLNTLNAQEFVNQLLIGSGGIYGDDTDHVTVSSYHPVGGEITAVGGVVTESLQDMVMDGEYVFVSAQDSIVKYSTATNERLAIVACSNVNQLLVKNEKLFVSRWISPTDAVFVKVYNASDLTFVADVNGISGDAADMVLAQDTLYVAVNGGWQGTEGKLAVVNPNFELEREIDFGIDAIGIFDMFSDGSKIYTVNRSPWGLTSGSITTYNLWTNEFTTQILESAVGKGFDLYQGVLYFLLDGAIASYDLQANEVLNNEIISATNYTFSAAAYDHVNNQFYVAETDYTSFGNGSIYNASGELIENFDLAVSTEVLRIDYQYNDISFEDIDFWVGNGQKQAIFVVDWNDGNSPEALAWGYRWDGDASGEDLLNAIAYQDDRLSVQVGAGFLNTLTFEMGEVSHSGVGGVNGFYWATFSGTSTADLSMNSGIGTTLADGDWFACSYTDFNPTIAPEVATPVSDPAAINENTFSLTVFPNPATTFISIDATNIQKIELVSLDGVKVMKKVLNTSTNLSRIDIRNLINGVYLLKVFTADGVFSNKFVKN